jgi:hypothetical protein
VHLFSKNYNPKTQHAIRFNFEQFPRLKEVFDNIRAGLVEKSTSTGSARRKKKTLAKGIDEMETITNCQTQLKALKKMTSKMLNTIGQLISQLEEVNMALTKTEMAMVQIAEKQQLVAAHLFSSMSQLLKRVAKPDGTINLIVHKEDSDHGD